MRGEETEGENYDEGENHFSHLKSVNVTVSINQLLICFYEK